MLHFLVGLIAFTLGACGIIAWWDNFGEFLRGIVPLLLVLFGLAAIGTGIKSSSNEEAEEMGKSAEK